VTEPTYFHFQLVDRESGEERILGLFTDSRASWNVGDVIRPGTGRIFQIAAIEPFEAPSVIPIQARWVVRRVA
jgi:hypothetical protein